MELFFVDSDSVDQAGYDEEAMEAHVIFKRGGHYIYSEISGEVWDQFLKAPSKGTFVNEEFKAKNYPCRRV